MKKNILKSVLCLSLSAAMVFGEAGAVLAEDNGAAAAEAASEAETSEAETAEAETAEAEEDAAAAEASDAEAEASDAEAEAADAKASEAETSDTETELTDTEAVKTEDTEAGNAAAAGAEAAAAAEEAPETETEAVDSLGAKIVAAYNLADVTGLAYDMSGKILSWNKVPGANSYKVEAYDAAGSLIGTEIVYTVYCNVNDIADYAADAVYSFKVTARNNDELYLVAADISDGQLAQYKSGVDYDVYTTKTVLSTSGIVRSYTLYKYPASVNAAVVGAVVKTSASRGVSALTGIAVKETTDSSVTFTVTPNTLQDGEYVQYTYANNAAYQSNSNEGLISEYNIISTNGGVLKGDITVDITDFTAGDTVYIKANVYNPNYDYTAVPGQTAENRKSAEVTAAYKIPAAVLSDVGMIVTKDSVRLEPYSVGNVTGYQYQRKNGKKWTNLAQQADNYTDEGLKADTKYTYRVRGYIYNNTTGKTSYTDWKTVSAMTWGSSLNLKAAAASTTAVKLTWTKVSSASGYEIYRVDTSSTYYNVKNGETTEAFENAALVKTIKSSKTVKYTDKKLTNGNTYKYIVRAFRTVGKTKCYIEESAEITLSAKGMKVTASYYNAKGQYVVKWNKMTGISGFKVEKKDAATGNYTAYKTLKKTATSVTLPKVAAGGASVVYRIRPYKGSKIYGEKTVEVRPVLAAVKNVKAVQTAEGVQVSWSKVAGADYYLVYRAKQDSAVYNQTTKTYSLGSGAELVYEVNYEDTSAGISLAPAGAPETYTLNGKSYTRYNYSAALDNAVTYSGKFYNAVSSYKNSEITGTTVVDKTVKVQSLVLKSEDAAYNKAADPEYVAEEGYYTGSYGEYQKNADGSLKTKTTTVNAGPKAGTEYYYFVIAVAKPANGAAGNNTYTSGVGYTKSAKVVYTNVAAAKATKLSSVKSSKKAAATIKIKKVSGVKGYAIYRSAKKSGTYIQIGTTTGTSYTDTNVTGGKTYYYKVASYKQSENGTFIYSKLSAAKKVKVKK